jgi:Pyruvate/2-oxoacid:ferredoxin oxidoreductase delta subunit
MSSKAENVIIIGGGFAGLFAAIGASTVQTRKITLISSSSYIQSSLENIDRESLYSKNANVSDSISVNKCVIHSLVSKTALSELWGRGIEPPHIEDSAANFMYKKYEEAYRVVSKYIPIANTGDELDDVFYFPQHVKKKIELDERAKKIFAHWVNNQVSLNNYFKFGKTRLSVSECSLCGQCFNFCPLNSMYSSRDLFKKVQLISNIKIVENFQADHYVSKNGNVSVVGKFLDSDEISVFNGEKLVVAAGPVNSVMIYMRSSNCEELIMQQSDMLRIPFISLFKLSNSNCITNELCLSQLTVAFKDLKLSNYPLVGHLFTLTKGLIDVVFPNINSHLKHIFWKFFRNRLVIVSLFFNSKDSGAIRVKYKDGKFLFLGEKYKKSLLRYVLVLLYFAKLFKFSGLFPIPHANSISKPGESIHLGGGIPVNDYGESQVSQNVYFADASSMENVPAGSYTFSIMAHAYFVGNNL